MMITLLCSQNDSVLRRWSEALKDDYRSYQATTIEQVYKIISKTQVDLVFLHRSMMDEQQLKRFIHDVEIKTFILTDRPNNSEGILLLKLGCIGYSNTYISSPRLNLAARTVLSGLVWTGTSLMQHLLETAAENQSEDKSDSPGQNIFSNLSKREYQVAALVSEGLHKREIAERLGITERTVKAHISSIYSKTESSSRVSLAKLFVDYN